MSPRWRKRLGLGAAVIGGVALGVAGKDSIKGFASSAGDTIGGLVGQLANGRPLADFLPNTAAVRDAAEDLIKGTPAGKAAQQQAIIQKLGAFFTSPFGLGAVGLVIVWFLMRKR